MKLNYAMVMAVATAGILGMCSIVRAQDTPEIIKVTGEIGWVDVIQGKLELNNETSDGTKTTAYRITQNETRVTDSADEKFLNIDDLRAGQYVTMEVINSREDKIVPKIVVDPMPVSKFQMTFGELQEIDGVEGTLVVKERIRVGQQETMRLKDFIFYPKTIVVMRSTSKQPVELMLRPGDTVKVEYLSVDGENEAKYITMYAPVVTSTTTTTTTTISR